jgi:hypothetical protein
MPTWVECTDSEENQIHVNLDLVTMMRREAESHLTAIYFVLGPRDDALLRIKETPEQVKGLATRAR